MPRQVAAPDRRWPLGLIGALTLIALGERAVSRRAVSWTPPLLTEWRAARVEAGREAKGCEWLALGSSMVKNGVLPGVIEDRTGRRGFNLAIPGAPPSAAYFVLRRALEQGARPSAVVVDFPHERLEEDPCPAPSVAAWAHLLGAREAIELAFQRGDPSFAGRLLTARLLTTARLRHELRTAVLAALGGSPVDHSFATAVHARNRRVNRGALAQSLSDGFADVPPESGATDRSESWRCHPVNAAFLDRFLRLAHERGLRVDWLMPPHSPGHQAVIDRSRAEVPYTRLVGSLATAFPNLRVIDARFSAFPASVFVDPVHLDSAGAAALSAELAPILDTPGRGWVSLPAFRQPRDAVEDLNSSIASLKSRTGPLRR
jgi:hypothetical protein